MMWIQETSIATHENHSKVVKVGIWSTDSPLELKVKLSSCITTPLFSTSRQPLHTNSEPW